MSRILPWHQGPRLETATSHFFCFPVVLSRSSWTGKKERKKKKHQKPSAPEMSDASSGDQPHSGLRGDVTGRGHAPLGGDTSEENRWEGEGAFRRPSHRQQSAAAALRPLYFPLNTTRFKCLGNTQKHDAHNQNGGPRATGAESQTGRAGGEVRWYGSSHEVGK